jgi:phthalate 4,5-cis-dihydrodiol dehydrogenase
MLPTFQQDRRVTLVAACDPVAVARRQFVFDFGGEAYATAEALCNDQAVELVYVASPHEMHAEHVALAAAAGKHVLLEKPMAITLDECTEMIASMQIAKRSLVVGHSHSFDAPVVKARELIDSGEVGAVRMIQALNYTDFMYRPRRPEELQTAAGGGVVHSQAAHQIDVVRMLGGGLVRAVRAHTGRWDPARATEGAYSALLSFADGAFASLTYSGYGHFDSDEWMDWTSELGVSKGASGYGGARMRHATFASTADEVAAKAARNYGGAQQVATAVPTTHQHFGPVVVACERGDLRLTAAGVWVYADTERYFVPVPVSDVPRREVIDEIWAVLREGKPAAHDGEWARATTEVSLAILESARLDRDVTLLHQCPWRR